MQSIVNDMDVYGLDLKKIDKTHDIARHWDDDILFIKSQVNKIR